VILVAYDGSADARAAIEQAGELLPGQAATILTVWVPFMEVMVHTGAGFGLAPGLVDFEAVDKASGERAGQTAEQGAELARQAGLDARPTTRMQRMTITEAILSEAAAIDARVIILGSRGLTGIKSALLGSVSHGVLNHADRPVLVVPSPEVVGERLARAQPAS
jgi:nucleotide-binding universal stress UspA family protein